ncbi:MAG: methyltransferase domain-containing protein [Terriglobales bacterium]
MQLKPTAELLDDDLGSPEEITRSLDELWWINQHLGGLSSWRKLLRQAALPRGLTLLDIGSGTGQVAAWIGTEMQARVVALDRRASHLGGDGRRVAADALRLPFLSSSFDVVTCNLFLHHFHGEPARALLGEMARVTRRAVIINDLERGWIPWLAIQTLGVRFSRITRHDGPRSVGQAYTRLELEALARQAAPDMQARCRRYWPYRLGLLLERSHA